MRQVGYLAAAGIYALDHNIERLQEDHHRAKLLGKALMACDWVEKVEPIETNIIIFKLYKHLDEKLFLTGLDSHDLHGCKSYLCQLSL